MASQSCGAFFMTTIQGHRGCRGLLPENTIESCLKAIELGCDYIEIDVCVTGNNEILVSHDPYPNQEFCSHPTIKLTSKNDKEFNFFKMSHEEIKEFDCGSKYHKRFQKQKKHHTYKPLLKELVSVLEEKKRNDFIYNIEIKLEEPDGQIYFPPAQKYVELLLNELDELGITSRCLLQSFDTRPLEIIHQQRPDIQLGYIVGYNDLEVNLELLSFTPIAYVAHYTLVDSELIKKVHDRNMKLFVWTVNKEPIMRKMYNLGVDSIITDYPDRLLNLISKL